MNYWLRLYTSILNDPKVQLLPDKQFKHWVNLLCIAKENDGLLPEIGDIAFRLRMSDAEAETLLVDLRKRGLLDEDGETLKPHNWDERQYKSDVSGETSKQYRDKLAGENGTERNYIYFIGTTLDRIVKVGVSKNPWARVVEFQTGSPEKLSVLATFRTDRRSELDIHDLLDSYRQHGEWFLLPDHIQQTVSVAAASKQTYAQLVELLRGVLRSKPTELRSEPTTDNYATTTESEQRQSRAETEPDTEQSREPRAPKRTAARRRTQCDEELFSELQANPAYAMFDVRMIYHKMAAWCKNKGKVPTPGRLVNWLNREERPLTASFKPPKGNAHVGKSPPPFGNDAYMAESVEELIAMDDIASIGQLYDAIVSRGGAKAEWEVRCVAYYELHKDEPATPEQMAELDARIQALAKR